MSQRNISSCYWLAAGYLALLSLLAGCDSKRIDLSGGKTAAAGTQQQTQVSNPSGDAFDPWGGPVPTAIHYGAQCPGATNAEIDAALQSNNPWVCHAATREAAR